MQQKSSAKFIEAIALRLGNYVDPLTVENVITFFDGFNLGSVLSNEGNEFNHFIDAWLEVVEKRGWHANSFGLEKEMREKGLSDKQIIEELVAIYVDAWKIVEASIIK